jgi:hypothetical protein
MLIFKTDAIVLLSVTNLLLPGSFQADILDSNLHLPELELSVPSIPEDPLAQRYFLPSTIFGY